MAVLPLTLGETARLSLVLENGDQTQFPRANVYEQGNATPIATLDLNHIAEGLYEHPVGYTPAALGMFNVVYTVYADNTHLVTNPNFSKELDQLLVQPVSTIEVTLQDIIDRLIRILGLTHENAYIDNTEYDDCCQLVSSRLRIFDSAASALLATDGGNETTGLVATYQVVADYEGPSKMKTYRMIKL